MGGAAAALANAPQDIRDRMKAIKAADAERRRKLAEKRAFEERRKEQIR